MTSLDKEEIDRRTDIVINQYEGIVSYCEAFYIQSLMYSAAQSIEAFQRYDHALDKEYPAAYLVGKIQEAIGHAAALSRYFWPSPQGRGAMRKLKESRGQKLRVAFQVCEDSPIYDRGLRNAWEHFDERLDNYLIHGQAGMFFPGCIVGSHKEIDEPINHVFKLLDSEAKCLVLLGEKFFFAPIRDEVERILRLADAADQNGASLRNIPGGKTGSYSN